MRKHWTSRCVDVGHAMQLAHSQSRTQHGVHDISWHTQSSGGTLCQVQLSWRHGTWIGRRIPDWSKTRSPGASSYIGSLCQGRGNEQVFVFCAEIDWAAMKGSSPAVHSFEAQIRFYGSWKIWGKIYRTLSNERPQFFVCLAFEGATFRAKLACGGHLHSEICHSSLAKCQRKNTNIYIL